MTALAYGLFEGLIAPTSNISWMCTLTSSYIPGGMNLYHALNGIGLLTLMECLTIDVLPKSKSSWGENASKFLYQVLSFLLQLGLPLLHSGQIKLL